MRDEKSTPDGSSSVRENKVPILKPLIYKINITPLNIQNTISILAYYEDWGCRFPVIPLFLCLDLFQDNNEKKKSSHIQPFPTDPFLKWICAYKKRPSE